MLDNQTSQSNSEPSVWDHFVEKIKFWNKGPAKRNEPDLDVRQVRSRKFPWFALGALILALIAQITLEPSPTRTPWPGVVLYALALCCLVGAIFRKEWSLKALKPDAESPLKFKLKIEFLLTGLILAILAFILFGNGAFSFLNTSLWVLSIIFIFLIIWEWHVFISEYFIVGAFYHFYLPSILAAQTTTHTPDQAFLAEVAQ